jgi:hypothetical protein
VSPLLVLGYPKTTNADRPSITVPPFHTGHLGFVPGTPVRVGLVATQLQGRHCEVVVTPFTQEARYLATISVVMRDEPGVVARLTAAVAELGINIEVQESSSVSQLNHHFVSLFVDLSESPIWANEDAGPDAHSSPTAVQRLYRGYGSVFPVRDFRFVQLFESIVAHCADIVVWKEVSGERLPDIEIRPYSHPRLSSFEVKPLVRGDSTLHVEIDVPGGIAARLKRSLGATDQLEYLLVSDTTTRALHAFFLHPDVSAAGLFHVGFFHDDVPGAQATILALLRDADFNILTCLIRKQGDGRSVWEAVLEYRGRGNGDSADMPPSNDRHAHSPIGQAELDWICDKIVAAQRSNPSATTDCGIVVAPPAYPVRPEGADEVRPVALSEQLGPAQGAAIGAVGVELAELLAQRRIDMGAREIDESDARRSNELLDLIARRSSEDGQPRIFLSYPYAARKHGEALEERLSSQYLVDKYQEPNGEVIVDEVIAKIEGSDYFIGIWHHDGKTQKGKRTKNVSPWMLFEYGVARSAEKPAIVVHSCKLHKSVWQRIDPGVSNPEYTDFDFDPDTIDTIWEYCSRNFR